MQALSQPHTPSYQCKYNPTFEDYHINNCNFKTSFIYYFLDVTVGCGSEVKAKLFFFSFTIMMSTVFMKLFIAIIWQTFLQTVQRENKFMSTDLVTRFREVWSQFDNNVMKFNHYSIIGYEFYEGLLISQFFDIIGRAFRLEHNF